MARTKKEEIRQKKGHGRTDEAYFIELHKTIAFSVSKMKIIKFLYWHNSLIYSYNTFSRFVHESGKGSYAFNSFLNERAVIYLLSLLLPRSKFNVFLCYLSLLLYIFSQILFLSAKYFRMRCFSAKCPCKFSYSLIISAPFAKSARQCLAREAHLLVIFVPFVVQ